MERKKELRFEQLWCWALSVVRHEDSMISHSQEADVTEQTLYSWRDLFIEDGCERFHGSLKDEEAYWNLYDIPADERRSLDAYQERYNRIRPHWALQPVGGGDPLVPSSEQQYK